MMYVKPTIHIAVADDQALFRECLISNIKSFGTINILIEASNGKQLLDQVKVTDIKPDIVLMDLNMPEMNGIEATQQIRALLPDIKIIILSVHGDEKNIARMIQQGVNGYLAKNAELSEVKRAIETTFEKGFYFNDTVIKVMQSGILQKKHKTTAFETSQLLTSREKEILNLICKEFTTPEIAEKLFLSVRTVDGHRNNLLEKTGSRNTAGLVLFAIKHELI